MNTDIQPYDNDEYSAQDRFEREEAYIRAKKKLEKLVGFYWHLAVYVAVNAVIIIIIVANSDLTLFSFGTWATAFFWGIGLFFHFIGVFGPDMLFSKKWEERKIRELMEKDKRRWE